MSGPPCVYDEPVSNYMNNKTVRDALHIPADAPAWELCSSSINYTVLPEGSVDVYTELRGIYRMLVFSGTTDGAVPTIGTQKWIADLDWGISEAWRPYRVNGKIAGFIESREAHKFVFATIHGTGHMAAQWKRAETYHLIDRFVKGVKI